MNRTLARFLLASVSFLAFVLLLSPSGWVDARGRGPNSLQPDSSAVIFTMVLQRDEPVSHGNFLILPSPNSHASTYAKGGSSGGGGGKGGGSGSSGGGGGGSTGPCCGGALTVTFSGSPYSTAELVETPTTTQPEAEEDIAADPTNPGNLFAAISDFSSSAGYNNTKWALSTDGGTSWIQNFVLSDPVSGQLLTSDNATWDANSDPVVAFDNSGNVYLSDLYLKLDSYGRIIAEGLYVGSGAFGNIGGTNFTSTYPVLTNLHNGNTFNIEDKPWIALDKTGPSSSTNGYVYASWSHFTGCQNQYDALVGGYVLVCSSDSIYLSYSTDHGHTWLSTPITISPGSQDGAVQGSQPAVGPDGTVYVTYELMGSNNQRQ